NLNTGMTTIKTSKSFKSNFVFYMFLLNGYAKNFFNAILQEILKLSPVHHTR
ncbi:hypothetical protein L9F63_015831, partial [Diploptera punctata]